jgi:hypothetical protein
MPNKKTFMETTIIYSLQGFHIHYGMYVVEMRIGIVLLFFYLFYKIYLF